MIFIELGLFGVGDIVGVRVVELIFGQGDVFADLSDFVADVGGFALGFAQHFEL